jgi:hypothetical protein
MFSVEYLLFWVDLRQIGNDFKCLEKRSGRKTICPSFGRLRVGVNDGGERLYRVGGNWMRWMGSSSSAWSFTKEFCKCKYTPGLGRFSQSEKAQFPEKGKRQA